MSEPTEVEAKLVTLCQGLGLSGAAMRELEKHHILALGIGIQACLQTVAGESEDEQEE